MMLLLTEVIIAPDKDITKRPIVLNFNLIRCLFPYQDYTMIEFTETNTVMVNESLSKIREMLHKRDEP